MRLDGYLEKSLIPTQTNIDKLKGAQGRPKP